MSETLVDTSQGYEHYIDRVPAEAIPGPYLYIPDTDAFVEAFEPYWGPISSRDESTNVSEEVIRETQPLRYPTTRDDVGINFERLASVMTLLARDEFDSVTRMGASFKDYKLGRTNREVQLYAAQVMGMDAPLGEHSLTQFERSDKASMMQQLAHAHIFDGIKNHFGNKRSTIKAYNQIRRQLAAITIRDAKLVKLCGFSHDFGEAALGYDKPFDEKQESDAILELGYCIDLVNQLYTITKAPKIEAALRYRVQHESKPDATVLRMRDTHAGYYLHPCEITNALSGTEHMTHGETTAEQVVRGQMFKAIERVEYGLSGPRALEAIEYNYCNIRSETSVVPKLLRLGVGTFMNHMRELMGFAEQFPMVYDFMRQNEATFKRYIDLVREDIAYRAEHPDEDYEGRFGMDPFIDYPERATDRISRDQAKQTYLQRAGEVIAWYDKQHLMRAYWEVNLGTEHSLTANQKDVTFTQYTAQTEQTGNGLIVVKKPLFDAWGYGIDEQSRQLRASKVANII